MVASLFEVVQECGDTLIIVFEKVLDLAMWVLKCGMVCRESDYGIQQSVVSLAHGERGQRRLEKVIRVVRCPVVKVCDVFAIIP